MQHDGPSDGIPTPKGSEAEPLEGKRKAEPSPLRSEGLPKARSGLSKSLSYPRSVDTLIAMFSKLPGIGKRSAERLAFHVLKNDAASAHALAQAIRDVKDKVRHCSVCWSLADTDCCSICADDTRDRGVVLVVEQPKDLIALEQTGMYKGLYHVLMGRLSPLEGVGPDELTIGDLLLRVRESTKHNAGSVKVREVILGLNPTLEGDGTGMYLAEELKHAGVKVSRLARGLPSGSQLEYANKAVLADAILGRQNME